MLVKSLRAHPSLLLFLLFCTYLGYELSLGVGDGASPPRKQVESPQKPGAPSQEPLKTEQPPTKPKDNRIGIVTFVTEQRSYLHLSLKNHAHYARRHGYDFIVDFEEHSKYATLFWKFEMIDRLIKTGDYDWLWWMDFDTLVTNTDIKVRDIIDETLRNATNPDEIDYMLTHDCNGLNLGSFIVRAHDRSLIFSNSIYHRYQEMKKQNEEHISEQDVLNKLLDTTPDARARTTQVQQQKLNAFPQEIACYDKTSHAWEAGDFVIHFAGAWAHVQGDDATGQLMNKYEGEIRWGDAENLVY